MLRRVSLTNFRKHVNLTLNFTSGLNVARGVNECGKSTLVESVQYALFGSGMLRTTLDDAVTWGQKASTLKVELDIGVKEKVYTFTRSSAGAEVTHEGAVLVTGQREVSAFATMLLGADGKAVKHLLFANQNAIRGALEEGPKAVATQIETLCDFDIFDQIIERMQEKLIIGSPSILESRLREAEEKLQAYVEPKKPDLAEYDVSISRIEQDLVRNRKTLEGVEHEVASTFSAHQNAENAQRMHTTLAANLRKQEEDLRLHEAQLAKTEEKVKAAPNQGEIDCLKAQLADAQVWDAKVKAHSQFKALTYPEAFWEGSKGSLADEIDRLQASIAANQETAQSLVSKISEARGRANLLRSKIITSLTCPTCGQEVKNKDEIAAQNARLEAEVAAELAPIEAWIATASAHQREVVAGKQDLDDLRAVLRSSEPFEIFATRFGEYVEVDLNFVPPRLTWKGEPPAGDALDTQAIKNRLSALEQSQDEARRAAGQAEALRSALVDDRASVERAREQLAQYPEVANVEDLKREHSRKVNASVALKAEIQGDEAQVVLLTEQRKTIMGEYEAEIERGNVLRTTVAQAQADLRTLSFNNALLKKVRAIRPLVADRLWNQVLAAVSTMFSSIRGEKSVVTKDADGFKVNGQAVESLSGSTLDALGMAIRVALIKTFLPHTSFLVADEPAAGCDADRTLNLLSFMSSLGMTQTLLITHEDLSETLADNLITL